MSEEIHPEYQAIFAPNLREGETLLWAGPAASNAEDERYRRPIMMGMWGIIFPIGILIFVLPGFASAGAPVGGMVFGILAVIGWYIFILRKSRQRMEAARYMVYGLSDQRVFFHDRRSPNHQETVLIDRIQGVTRKGQGIGTLIFRGLTPPVWFPAWNAGLITLPHERFTQIKDPEIVERLLLDAMTKKDPLP